MSVKYYDIGLNLFCKQFPDSEKIIQEAMNCGVYCILTGTDTKENRKINEFVKTHEVIGTAGIHPHNADRASQEDFKYMEQILIETDAPYLTPRNVPGLDRINVPQNIVYVAKELAKYMNVSEELVIENAKRNTERIFNLKNN